MSHGGSWQIFALEHPGNRSSGNPQTQLIRRQSVIGSWMFQHCRLSLLFEHCQDEGVQMPDLLTDAGLSIGMRRRPAAEPWKQNTSELVVAPMLSSV